MTKIESGDNGKFAPFSRARRGRAPLGVGARPLFESAERSPAAPVEPPAASDQISRAGGRAAADDYRIALHEASHATTGRLLGSPLGGCTIVPGPTFSGLCWGPTFQSRFTPSPPVRSLCEQITPLLPIPGENRECISEIVLHCHNRVVELVSGSLGELLFLGSAWPADSDRAQERALASLVASSPDSIEAFVAFARREAEHLLRTHAHVVRALADELLKKRTLDSGEIDEVIRGVCANKAVADERERRLDWRAREASAKKFRAMVEA
ncbi:hypothetical protein [Bradyrhizobium erythrophlei]|uniref:Peptidase M41 domain-containing protein n=1 Tax=Bradyrhizobium erythrophlei TaxID=1437360 RepID=A0A1M5S1N0_9BRAD|nr:hypothetical protein [Bradyrhizobium erythrophlei]SHH32238.1 hypothetical protein SAMN05444169_6886 [Bradyrhizobium erythrophlei]